MRSPLTPALVLELANFVGGDAEDGLPVQGSRGPVMVLDDEAEEVKLGCQGPALECVE